MEVLSRPQRALWATFLDALLEHRVQTGPRRKQAQGRFMRSSGLMHTGSAPQALLPHPEIDSLDVKGWKLTPRDRPREFAATKS